MADAPEHVKQDDISVMVQEFITSMDIYCELRNNYSENTSQLREVNETLKEFSPSITAAAEEIAPKLDKGKCDIQSSFDDILCKLEQYHMNVLDSLQFVEQMKHINQCSSDQAIAQRVGNDMNDKLKYFTGKVNDVDQKQSDLRILIDKSEKVAPIKPLKSISANDVTRSEKFQKNTKDIADWCRKSDSNLQRVSYMVRKLECKMGYRILNYVSHTPVSKDEKKTTSSLDQSTTDSSSLTALRTDMQRYMQINEKLEERVQELAAKSDSFSAALSFIFNRPCLKAIQQELKDAATSSVKTNMVSVGTQSPRVFTKTKSKTSESVEMPATNLEADTSGRLFSATFDLLPQMTDEHNINANADLSSQVAQLEAMPAQSIGEPNRSFSPISDATEPALEEEKTTASSPAEPVLSADPTAARLPETTEKTLVSDSREVVVSTTSETLPTISFCTTTTSDSQPSTLFTFKPPSLGENVLQAPSSIVPPPISMTGDVNVEEGMDQDGANVPDTAPGVNFNFNCFDLGQSKPAESSQSKTSFGLFSNRAAPQKSSLFGGTSASSGNIFSSGTSDGSTSVSNVFGGNVSTFGGGANTFGGSAFGGATVSGSFGSGATFGAASPFQTGGSSNVTSTLTGKIFSSPSTKPSKTFGMFANNSPATPKSSTLFSGEGSGFGGVHTSQAGSVFGSGTASTSNTSTGQGGASIFGNNATFGSSSPFAQNTSGSSTQRGGKSTAFTTMRK